MGVMLYRKGNTHTIRGITCEMGKFPAEDMDEMIKAGWSTSPQRAYRMDEVSLNKKMNKLNDLVNEGARYSTKEELEEHLKKLKRIQIKDSVFHERTSEAFDLIQTAIQDIELYLEIPKDIENSEGLRRSTSGEECHDINDMSNNEIREAAKLAKIKGWKTKYVSLLKNKLKRLKSWGNLINEV